MELKKLKKYARSDMFDYRPGIIYSHLPFYKDEIGEELEAQIQKYEKSWFFVNEYRFTSLCILWYPSFICSDPVIEKNIGLNPWDISETAISMASGYAKNTESTGLKQWIKQDFGMSIIQAVWQHTIRIWKNEILNWSVKKTVEVYVHPVLVGDHLIDNYTGGTHLKESFHRTGLAKSNLLHQRIYSRIKEIKWQRKKYS